MKKIAVMLLCLCLIAAFPLTAFAQNTNGGDTHISTVVPSSHKITVDADGAEVLINGTAATEFTVERLSAPTITFKPESGKQISSVMLNGEDITDKITDGSYTLESVYQDIVISVTTEAIIQPPTVEPPTEPTTENPSTTAPTTNPQSGSQGNSATEESNTNNQGTNPIQTGQAVHIALWIVFMISLAAIIVLSRRHSKKDN
ncbi:MAG: hypothetical protein ACI4HZ_11455 [Ruminococcus sp.]